MKNKINKPTDVTNFPQEGDDLKPSLRNSEYERPPYDYVLDLKENWPDIWGKGGNIRGNDAFAFWSSIRDKSQEDYTQGEIDWLYEREDWSARHYRNKNIEGVVAQLKWALVGSRGMDHMREVINEEKDKIREEKNMQGIEQGKKTKKQLPISIKQLGDPKDRVLRFIASDETPDRDEDIIEVSGWDTKDYLGNPVFLWMHDYTLPPLGKCINLYKDVQNKQFIMDIQFIDPAKMVEHSSLSVEDVHDYVKFADMVYHMYLSGALNAVSVGFIPLEYDKRQDLEHTSMYGGYRIKKASLLELSSVTVPANPSALVQRSVKSMDKDATVDEMLTIVDKFVNIVDKSPNTEKGTLKENGTVENDPSEISESAWNSSAVSTELDAQQLAEYSLVWNNLKAVEDLTKQDSKFPHHETDGKINKNALVAIKAALSGARGGANPFPDQTQEEFDAIVKNAVENHLNPHLELVELEIMDLENIKSMNLSEYMKAYEDHFDSEKLYKAYDAENFEQAYKCLTEEKALNPEGDISVRDIEREIDRMLRVQLEGQDKYAFSLDFYPYGYPLAGKCTVYHSNQDKEYMHKYTVNPDQSVSLDEGVEIERNDQYEYKSLMEKVQEKAGRRNSKGDLEKLETLKKMMGDASDTLDDLIGNVQDGMNEEGEEGSNDSVIKLLDNEPNIIKIVE